jgi:hypothetical protein
MNLAQLYLAPLSVARGSIPPILSAVRRAPDLIRAASKADQYFRPQTSRPNSMYADEMLEAAPMLPKRPAQKQLSYDENYRDPAYFGKRTEPSREMMAGDEGYGAGAAFLGERQQMARTAEEDFIRDQLARMQEEGGMEPMNELLRRQVRADEDKRFAARQLSELEGEGGLTADAIQAAKDLHNERIAREQAIRDAEVARWEDEGGGMAHTTTPPVFTRDFTMGETVPMTHGILQGKPYYGPLATRAASEESAATNYPLISAAIQEARNSSGSNLPLLAALGIGGVGGAAGLNYLYGDRAEPAISPAASSQTQREVVATSPAASGKSAEIDPLTGLAVEGGGANYTGRAATRSAQLNPVEVARQIVSQRQDAAPASDRMQINWGDPDRASDFFRASKQMQEAIKAGKDVGYYGQGENRGGSVQKKPDAVHKALEIIHHLVTR